MSQPFKQTRSDSSSSKPPDPITVEDVIASLKTRKIDQILSADQVSQLATVFTIKDVAAIHRNSDLDLRPDSYHHRNGGRSTNSAPGDHRHDGGNSVQLLDGVVISGSKSTAVSSVLSQILACLVTLGITDSTSA